MPIYEVTETGLTPLAETKFALAGVHERRDLQKLLRESIEIIAPDTLVIAEEFGDWEDSRRRIDLLAVDRSANIVVIELKRSEDGGHMELQAIRYAAMVSTMTFDQVVDVYARHLKQMNREAQDARKALLDFLDWEEPDDDLFAQDVRIVLASAEFSKEITSSVLWLIDYGINIRCVRLKPYQLHDKLLVDAQQIIPLPEAANYQIQVREKAQKEKAARVSNADFTRYDVSVSGETHADVWKRNALYLICKRLIEGGVTPDQIATHFTWRNNAWFEVDGTLGAPDFERLALKKAEDTDRSFDPGRWFVDDGELFHVEGKTYSFSKMWGGKGWHKAMAALKDSYPEFKISYSPAA